MFTGMELETEGKDRADLSLPGYQLQLLQDAVQAGWFRFLCLMYTSLSWSYILIY